MTQPIPARLVPCLSGEGGQALSALMLKVSDVCDRYIDFHAVPLEDITNHSTGLLGHIRKTRR